MPSIMIKRDGSTDSASVAAADHASNPTSPPVKSWIIAVIVAGLVLVVAVVVFFVVRHVRRKQYQRAKKDNVYLTADDFKRRRKMSELDRMEEDELRRSILIRKSLASRSTLHRSSHTGSTDFSLYDDDGELVGGLKEDWKEFEARVQHMRTVTIDQHPAESGTELAIPMQSRPRSASRGPVPPAYPTPALPSTPTFGPSPAQAKSSAPEPSRAEPASLAPAHTE